MKGGVIITVAEIIFDSGVGIFLILSLIQIAPLKWDPWTSLINWIGKIINKDLTIELKEIKEQQQNIQSVLNQHISTEAERNADRYRTCILQFNTEIKRGLRHTEEDFNQILVDIDNYQAYCKDHPEYPNRRAEIAIANIEEIYKKCFLENDFLI